MTTSKRLYVLVNIGCIECGVSTAIVGVFDDVQVAEAHMMRLAESHNWRQGGQNAFEVFPLPEVNAIQPEYAEDATPPPDRNTAHKEAIEALNRYAISRAINREGKP